MPARRGGPCVAPGLEDGRGPCRGESGQKLLQLVDVNGVKVDVDVERCKSPFDECWNGVWINCVD